MNAFHLSIKRPRTVLFLHLVVSLLAIYAFRNLQMDNSIDVWLAHDNDAYRTYEAFRERFGSEEYLLVALCDHEVFNEETFRLLGQIVDELSRQPALKRIDSLSKVYEVWKKSRSEGNLPVDFDTFRTDILSSPFYVGLLVSPTGRDTAVIAQLNGNGVQDRETVAASVRERMKQIVPSDRTVYYAGSPMFGLELSEISGQATRIFYPIVVLAGTTLLVLVLRSFSMVFGASLAVMMSILWGVGLLTASGRQMNLLTTSLVPILLVSTTSYALHFLLEFRRQISQHYDRRRAITAALDIVSIPCLLSAVTTSIGFGSLLVSDVVPVRELGVFTAIAVLGGFVTVVYGISAFLVFAPLPKHWIRKSGENSAEDSHLIFGFQPTWYPYRYFFLMAGILFSLVVGFYSKQVYFESNPYEFFPKGSPVTQSRIYLEHHLTGLSPVEVQIQSKNEEDLLTLETLHQLELASAAILSISHITKVITAADFVKETNRSHSLADATAFVLPRRPTQLRTLLDGIIDERMKERLDDYYSEGNRYTKMTIYAQNQGSRQYAVMIEKIQQSLIPILDEKYKFEIVGHIPLVVSAQKYMVTSQVQSLALAVLFIGLTFLLIFRSLRMTLLGVIPNFIPILGTFGFMGFTRIPLDIATIMVASVSMGIVVDNTIHFLYRYTRTLKRKSNQASVYETLKTTGKAITFAALSNCIGFGVLSFSGFQPMRRFGFLVSLTMFTALVGATILLPVVLLIFGKHGKSEK